MSPYDTPTAKWAARVGLFLSNLIIESMAPFVLISTGIRIRNSNKIQKRPIQVAHRVDLGALYQRLHVLLIRFTVLFIVSYRVFNCILVHFIPLPVFIFYSFTGIYILLILFLYSILSTLFPCTLYGLIFPFLFLYFYSIFVYSFSLFSVPAWMGLYRRGWDYTAWSVFV